MIPVQVYYALPYAVAFLLAVGIPIAAALQYRLARAITPELRIIILLLVVSVGALASVVLTPRILDERELLVAGRRLWSDFDDGFAASRYLNLFLVGTASVELVRGWLSARAEKLADPARTVMYGLVAFHFGTIAIQAFGSAHPDFSYKTLYLPVLLLAVYYQRIENLSRIIVIAKICLFVLMFGSLVGMAVKPDFVIHRPAPGVIPGVDFRLFGLATHANALGPMALVALILELYSPSQWRLLRWSQLLGAAAVLVLAQSKTAWVAGIFVLMFVSVPLGLMADPNARGKTAGFSRAVMTLWLCITALVVVVLGLFASDVLIYVDSTAPVDTLTGRTQIWELTLEAWRENVAFGYGREIWGAERMMKTGLFHVGQAHNQFIQTLGEAGLVGLVLLIVYLLSLLCAALGHFAASRGLAFGLLILVLARCVTEAPMRNDSLQTWTTFTSVLLIVFTCHFMRMATQRKFLLNVSKRRSSVFAK